MTVEVVTVTNRIPGPSEPYYRYAAWLGSLARLGVTPTVLGMDAPWAGLMTKPRTLRKWLREGKCKADCMIFTDSWDVVFVAHPDEIAEEWEIIGRPWIVGAEKALFPPGDEKAWPDSGSPYRFLNSGVIIAEPADMLAVLEAMDLDSIPDDHELDGRMIHGNDQEEIQKFFLKQTLPMRLDTECRFCWNLCDVPVESYELRDGRPFNRDTKTFPPILHANGGSKDGPIFLDVLKLLNL